LWKAGVGRDAPASAQQDISPINQAPIVAVSARRTATAPAREPSDRLDPSGLGRVEQRIDPGVGVGVGAAAVEHQQRCWSRRRDDPVNVGEIRQQALARSRKVGLDR
jgi:hypothetical protein